MEILSGVTKATLRKYQENQTSDSSSSQREMEDLQEIKGGIAASHRDAFEKGKVSNVERSKGVAGEENLPTAGIASKTRASIEAGAVIRAEERYVRETDVAEEMPTAGSASAVRRRFERKNEDDDKAKRRLSYEPQEGEAKGRLAMYMQSVEESTQKKQFPDEEDARPPPGAARGVRQMFEQDTVIHAKQIVRIRGKRNFPSRVQRKLAKRRSKQPPPKAMRSSKWRTRV